MTVQIELGAGSVFYSYSSSAPHMPHKLGDSIGSVGQAAALDAAEEILSVPILLTYLAKDL